MKAKLLSLLLLFLLQNAAVDAKVWRVNNADTTADFDDTDSAHDSQQVAAGDTLYVEGSRDYYTSFDCSKQLTIIGPGYFLSENKKSASIFEAKINYINFVDGAQGSRVIGMTFDYLSGSSANAYTDNISIERCFMRGQVDIRDVSGIRIQNNYLGGIDDYISSTSFTEVYFNNNVVTSSIAINDNCNIASCNNNIFLASSLNFRATHFRSNILINGNVTVNINSAFIQNNIATNNILDANNLNVNDITALFMGGQSPDEQYLLADNSAAKGAGYQGTDCGIFGGDDPYVISGLPPLPIITILEVDDAASVETGLKVKMTIISN